MQVPGSATVSSADSRLGALQRRRAIPLRARSTLDLRPRAVRRQWADPRLTRWYFDAVGTLHYMGALRRHVSPRCCRARLALPNSTRAPARLAGGQVQVWRASASQRTRCEWSTTLAWAVSARPRGSARHPRPHARRTPRAAHESCPACTGPIQNALLSRFAAPRRPQTGCLAVRKLSTGCLEGGYIRHRRQSRSAAHSPRAHSSRRPPTCPCRCPCCARRADRARRSSRRRACAQTVVRQAVWWAVYGLSGHRLADHTSAGGVGDGLSAVVRHHCATATAAVATVPRTPRAPLAASPRVRPDGGPTGCPTGCLTDGWSATRHLEVSETGCLLRCAATAPLLPWPHCPCVPRGRRTLPARARLDSLRTGCPGCHVVGWRCPDSPLDSPSDSLSDSRHTDTITVVASLSQARRARARARGAEAVGDGLSGGCRDAAGDRLSEAVYGRLADRLGRARQPRRTRLVVPADAPFRAGSACCRLAVCGALQLSRQAVCGCLWRRPARMARDRGIAA